MGCAASSSVEDSLCLSVSTLVKEKGTVGSWTRGSLRWSYEDCDPHAKTGYEANLIDPDTAWVRFTYTVNGTPMHYYVRLVTTQPTYGGLPWWFLRPLGRNDGGPPRRTAKLYLPPGKKYFASRQAHVLTYTSCQESGKYDALFRRNRRLSCDCLCALSIFSSHGARGGGL